MAAAESAVADQTWIPPAAALIGATIVYIAQVIRGRKSPEPTKELVLDRADPVDDETVKQLTEMLRRSLQEWAELKEDTEETRRITQTIARQLERLDGRVEAMAEKTRIDEARRQGREEAERERERRRDEH